MAIAGNLNWSRQMRRCFVFLLVLGAHYRLTAQEFRSGFIVTLEGDTVKGLLVDGTDAELSSRISFKSLESGNDKIEYRPTDVLSFGFDNGRIFIRFANTNASTEGDSVFVFAKRILEGKISLYTYSKTTGNHPDIFLVNNYSGRTVHLWEPKKLLITDESGFAGVGESFRHLGLIGIVKGDAALNSANVKKFKYTEKAIRNDILEYNEGFKDFPGSQYQPRIDYSYSVVAGVPFNSPNQTDVAFRVAFFRSKHFPESSRKLSFITGISYRYSYINSTVPSGVQNSNENFRQQWISLIPIGVNFQTDWRVIKPYVYIGAGIAFLWETNHYIDNYEYKGNKNEIFVTPTLNMGAGVRIKTGSKFLVAELSPTGNRSGTFINLGYSF